MHQNKRVGPKFSRKEKWTLFSGIVLAASLFGALLLSENPSSSPMKTTAFSSEINIAEDSPSGSAGGLIVPASCPSDLHDAPNYNQSCTSAANSCGMTNTGTIQCNGTCTATRPLDSLCCTWNAISGNCADYGFGTSGTVTAEQNSCTGALRNINTSGCSTPIQCGNGVVEGTEACDLGSSNGVCPSNCSDSCTINTCTLCGNGLCGAGESCFNCPNDCTPDPQTGNTCTGSANSCGMTNTGTYACDGSCNATVPPNSLCGGPGPGPCGDGTCTNGETCASCSADCGSCPPVTICGDGACNGIETCSNCSSDCGSCCDPNFGRTCQSNRNACNMRNLGTIRCDGNCSISSAPPDSLCGPQMHTISASAGSGGSISPSGAITLIEGSNRAFTITPSTNYVINTVTVDGIAMGPVGNYTFNNVQANHVIRATFLSSTAPQVTLSAVPTNVASGNSSVLSWVTTNTVSCTGSGGDASTGWSGAKSASGGSMTVTPTVSATYSIECWDGTGVSTGIQNVVITVGGAIPLASVTLTANKTDIVPGESVWLSWIATNAATCTSSTPLGNPTDFTGSRSVPSGSKNVRPMVNSIYSIECFNALGQSAGPDTISFTPFATGDTIKICPQTATVGLGGTLQLRAYQRNGGIMCNNPLANGGVEVTESPLITWSTPSNTGHASVSNVAGTKGLVTGQTVGVESVRARHANVSAEDRRSVQVVCTPNNDCSSAASDAIAVGLCTQETFVIDNGCGAPITCSGTRACDYNWKEVSP